MQRNTVCKTVHQYNKVPVSQEDMKKLQDIANDCQRVKEYVYRRYGGVNGLPKIYPGYTVQNEITKTGLRDDLKLPSVYFYLAVFDALGNIRGQWTRTKAKVLKHVNRNEGLKEAEKHYLRFLLKISNLFSAVLRQESIEGQKLPETVLSRYDELAKLVNTDQLHRYLCRQVRKYHVKLHTETTDGFSVSERAYRYGDHGIYISTKESRKRIFVPLTDSNTYNRQLYIRLYPEKSSVEIKIPIDVKVHRHDDYINKTGLSMGMFTMLTTDDGHEYGAKLGEYQAEMSGWIREQTCKYNENRASKSGRKKYHAKKHRLNEQQHSYINMELNRFLKTEKPEVIYIPRLPPSRAHGGIKEINNSVTLWQSGYIKNRLVQKCREHSVKTVEVFGLNISRECSRCGAAGEKKQGMFYCHECGYYVKEKQNAAQNARKRGICQAEH
ncbi:MAG: transposase [Clostridiales bacterium]|nr:transposase [Clostridiales bacterium]